MAKSPGLWDRLFHYIDPSRIDYLESQVTALVATVNELEDKVEALSANHGNSPSDPIVGPPSFPPVSPSPAVVPPVVDVPPVPSDVTPPMPDSPGGTADGGTTGITPKTLGIRHS